MKPISLTVAGLQSFREKQTIPFGELCSGGVFGIFGPTGSGKSTILDAITLALYGKVERANGGTHGIMNNNEDKLSVSFSFALNSSEGIKEYCVERSYKRTGEHTLRTASCRLTEMVNNEPIVHADKERDVTQYIQQILGLTIEDFTRAVVLPQGKFAEFLSLKGAERRQMLQRLFQLEKYGDALNAKLKKRFDEEKSKVNEIIAEQNGLGDASAEAFEAAERALKECELQLIVHKKRQSDAEQQAEKARRLKEAQDKQAKLLVQREKLVDRQSEIDILKNNLEKAVQAERILPYYEEWKTKTEEKTFYEKKVIELSVEAERLRNDLYKAEKEAEALQNEQEMKVPFLTERISFMKEAAKKQTQLRERQKEQKASSQTLEVLTSEMEALSLECKKEVDLLEKGEQKKKQLLTLQSDNTVASEERRQLAEAAAIKSSYNQAVQYADSLRAELDKLKSERAAAAGHYSLLSEKKKDSEHIVSEQMNQLQIVFDRVCEAKRANEKVRKLFLSERKAYRENVEKNRREELALELARSLKDGEPCAVCGSSHHPFPFKDAEEKQTFIDFDEERLDESIRTLESQAEKAGERLENIAAKIMERHSSSRSFVDESAASVSGSSAVNQTGDVGRGTLEDQLHEAWQNMKKIVQDIIELDEKANKFYSSNENLMKKLNEAELQMKMLEKLFEPLQVKLNEAVHSCEEAKNRFDKLFSFTLDDVDSLTEELQNKDRVREEAEKRLTIAETFLGEKMANLAAKHAQQNDLDKKLTLESVRNESIKKEAEALAEEIKAVTGNHDPEELLQRSQQELEQLNRKVKDSTVQLRKMQEAYSLCDKEHHSYTESLKTLEKGEMKAEKIVTEKLSDSIFDSAEQMAEAAVSFDVQSSWKEMIVSFEDEWKALQDRILIIEQSLHGEQLSNEEYLEIIHDLETVKKEVEEASQRLGEARSTYTQLSKNYQRFAELETKRKKSEALCENYSKLQAVFRGNTFVEFAAEEQLHQITKDASERLAKLTRGRYAIEVDSTNGFVMRDDANGGIKRPVSSLSGGETFLTSLALALSLSAQIQLRGKYPLEFFFLDEGFGTLDQELLDTVITALEKLQFNSFSIGVISHVPELQARLSKKIIVKPSDLAGNGTTVALLTE
ncbi:SbcC/MukB-like Walker B domain-containing protein [Fictibacillus iocasae]|uniref:Nuclease SbcCD subunit C n=1 Tax=Fictibacillus iocasae TaxID=2715437 RepID=A0ABW2NR71_9BACL